MASPDCVDKLPASHEGETVSAALRTWVAEMRNIESVTFKTAVEGQEFSISRDDVGKKCRGRTRVLEVIVDDETVDHINLGGDEAVQKARLRPPVVAPPLAFCDLRVKDLLEFDMIGECWWEVQVVAVSSNAVHVLWEGKRRHEIGAEDVATRLRRRPV